MMESPLRLTRAAVFINGLSELQNGIRRLKLYGQHHHVQSESLFSPTCLTVSLRRGSLDWLVARSPKHPLGYKDGEGAVAHALGESLQIS